MKRSHSKWSNKVSSLTFYFICSWLVAMLADTLVKVMMQSAILNNLSKLLIGGRPAALWSMVGARLSAQTKAVLWSMQCPHDCEADLLPYFNSLLIIYIIIRSRLKLHILWGTSENDDCNRRGLHPPLIILKVFFILEGGTFHSTIVWTECLFKVSSFLVVIVVFAMSTTTVPVWGSPTLTSAATVAAVIVSSHMSTLLEKKAHKNWDISFKQRDHSAFSPSFLLESVLF